MSNVISMSTLGRNGRFGNQILQYLFLRVYAQQHNQVVQTPADWIGRRLYDLNDPPVTRELPRVVDATDDVAKSPVLNAPQPLANVDLWGYFQFHTSFYAPHRELFRSIFKPVAEVRPVIDAALEKLRSRGKTIIGLHIRRGDYEDIHLNTHHIIPSNEILRQWLRQMWSKVEQPVLYLASDALDRMLGDFAEFSPVTERDIGPGIAWADFLLDFEILSRCNIVGISNSTFSFASCMFNDGGEFYRPTVDGRMEQFDAWNAPIVLRREKQLNVSKSVNVIQEFQKQPRTEKVEHALRETRREVTEAWLQTPADLLEVNMGASIGKLHTALLATKIRDNPASPEYDQTQEDQALADRLKEIIAEGPSSGAFLSALIAAQLMLQPHHLPLAVSLRAIPQWFQLSFLKYLLEQPQVFFEIGEVDRYHQFLRDWMGEILRCYQDEPKETFSQHAIQISAGLINMIPLYFANDSLKEAHRRRAQIVEAALQNVGHQLDFAPAARAKDRKRLKLGILAAHLQPVTETFTTLPHYEFVDRNRVEIVLYTLRPPDDAMARYCISRADRLVELKGNVQEQVNLLRSEDIDVLLVETNIGAVLNPITLLSAHRVARVQMTTPSSPCTTGLKHIDYYFSGTLNETERSSEYYTEKLIKVTGSGQCYQYASGPQMQYLPRSRAEFGIADDAVVYASGANYYKIIPETIHLWASVIESVPRSVLLLYPFGPAWTDNYQMQPFLYLIYKAFAEHGLGAERLVVLHSEPNRAAVKECLKVCDVYLDSIRHGGANSLIDPLEVGLPCVALEGQYFRARHGSANLRSIKLDELVAANEEEYRRLAVELGRNKELRDQRSKQVRAAMENNPPFLDSKRFAELATPVYFRVLQEKLNSSPS